jgi:riboflavin kinase, archaea type
MEKLKPALVSTLLELVLLDAHANFVTVSTEELAKRLDRSQQSASQHLRYLEKLGLIERRRSGVKSAVKLTPKGYDAIFDHYTRLKRAIEGQTKDVTLRGTVFQGLGEGGYYVNLGGYKRQFVELLGFEPFPGTLNLKLETPAQMDQKKNLRAFGGLRVEGFESGGRTYGGARCYRAMVNGRYPAAVLVIDRTHYDDSVLEIISPVHFRKELGLKDGEELTVKVFV